jgi:hypothetical protein
MKGKSLNRRKFFTILGVGGATMAVSPLVTRASFAQQSPSKPATNISDALKVPRKPDSMPGKYPVNQPCGRKICC